jgi:hypothetical protein
MQDKTDDVRKQLQQMLDGEGVSQQTLAARLGITQGHLSKVLRAEVPVSRRLNARARAIMGPASGDLLTATAAALEASPLFAKTIATLLEFMHFDARGSRLTRARPRASKSRDA